MKLQKKLTGFIVLLNLVTVLWSFSLVVFPEKKDSGFYLYAVIDTGGFDILNADVFITGENLFFLLDTFTEGSKLISVGLMPTEDIVDHHRYHLNIHIQTPEGKEIYLEELLGIKGVLLPVNPPEIPYKQVQIARHTVLPGEYLYKLASFYNVDRADLEILNQDKVNNLHAGDEVIIGRVDFQDGPYEILISLERCSLTLFYQGHELLTFPVALGRGNSTPPGIYYIKRMVEDPALYWEGEYIQPLAPINGLGKWWLELSNPQYGIHGTNKPWEIGKRISHGCIRMFNEDVTLLQSLIPVGTRVVIK